MSEQRAVSSPPSSAGYGRQRPESPHPRGSMGAEGTSGTTRSAPVDSRDAVSIHHHSVPFAEGGFCKHPTLGPSSGSSGDKGSKKTPSNSKVKWQGARLEVDSHNEREVQRVPESAGQQVHTSCRHRRNMRSTRPSMLAPVTQPKPFT